MTMCFRCQGTSEEYNEERRKITKIEKTELNMSLIITSKDITEYVFS